MVESSCRRPRPPLPWSSWRSSRPPSSASSAPWRSGASRPTPTRRSSEGRMELGLLSACSATLGPRRATWARRPTSGRPARSLAARWRSAVRWPCRQPSAGSPNSCPSLRCTLATWAARRSGPVSSCFCASRPTTCPRAPASGATLASWSPRRWKRGAHSSASPWSGAAAHRAIGWCASSPKRSIGRFSATRSARATSRRWRKGRSPRNSCGTFTRPCSTGCCRGCGPGLGRRWIGAQHRHCWCALQEMGKEAATCASIGPR
mmetsp:Transcript_60059/g.196064  ORF Transcript_60059/g.196064 Transcript_60059/m.196064 type:complete len:262 (+) Transcript_60059:1107-1892(+)